MALTPALFCARLRAGRSCSECGRTCAGGGTGLPLRVARGWRAGVLAELQWETAFQLSSRLCLLTMLWHSTGSLSVFYSWGMCCRRKHYASRDLLGCAALSSTIYICVYSNTEITGGRLCSELDHLQDVMSLLQKHWYLTENNKDGKSTLDSEYRCPVSSSSDLILSCSTLPTVLPLLHVTTVTADLCLHEARSVIAVLLASTSAAR